MSYDAIETWYAGFRFRSRLEARWAVFFNHLDLEWEPEPQGYHVGQRSYLPDFWLPGTQTWVEVKGSEGNLDHDLMYASAEGLPHEGPGPVLLILGPIPEPPEHGDLAWLGFGRTEYRGDVIVTDGWYGFGEYGIPACAHETSCAAPPSFGAGDWLKPITNMITRVDPRVAAAYVAARSARFEHGERG
jgi:hypothetical protein